jgi:PAS domain-containing protein
MVRAHEGRLLFVNDAAVTMLGYESSEALRAGVVSSLMPRSLRRRAAAVCRGGTARGSAAARSSPRRPPFERLDPCGQVVDGEAQVLKRDDFLFEPAPDDVIHKCTLTAPPAPAHGGG